MAEGAIIIGGGTHEARTIDHEYQSFLKIDGRTCIEIVLDEATKTDNGFPIYLWGPEDKLRENLSPIIIREKDRREIHIVPEKTNPIDSLIFTCLESSKRNDEESTGITLDHLTSGDWNLQHVFAGRKDPGQFIFYLPSDIPLVSHEEMNFFIKNADPDYDLLMGWSLRNGFEAVMKTLLSEQTNIDISRTKINFSRFIVNRRPEEARFNNIYWGRPLRIDPNLYLFIHRIYQNRNLIKKSSRRGKAGKKIDPSNFSRLFKAFSRYLRIRKTESGGRIFAYGYRILNTYFHSLGLEGKNYRYIRALARSLNWFDRRPPRSYIDNKFIEENVFKLTGSKIGLYFSNLIGPLLDIDTQYEYEFVKANFGHLHDIIDNYYATCGMRILP